MKTDEQKALLLKTIALLYKESKLKERGDNSADVAKKVNASVSVPASITGYSSEITTLTSLKRILGDMAENPITYNYSFDALMSDLRQACGEDLPLLDNFETTLASDQEEGDLKLSIINIRDSIKNYFKDREVYGLLNKSIVEWRDKDKIADQKKWFTDLVSSLDSYTVSAEEQNPALNAVIDLKNRTAIAGTVNKMLEMESNESILITGWQGINEMLDGGFRPGEQWVIGAMEHSWKTGFSLSLFRQIIQYNKPMGVLESGRKPCLVRISFEDTSEMNMQFLFKSIYENDTGLLVDDCSMTPEEITSYVYDFIERSGWDVFLFDINPSDFTYKDICNEILKLEARGYEVRLCMLDYLLKCSTAGCTVGPSGVDIRNLYERIKAFMVTRKCTMITPHQLSPDTKTKVREGTNNFVLELLKGGYYSGTKQLAQVIDGEIFINIEEDKKTGEAYLTIARGKHRKIKQTPAEYLYAVLKFIKRGVIPDDLNKPCITRRKVGGPTLAETADSAFDDMLL